MNRIRTSLTSDEGFGLTEIVVSMFMLALLAIAFLPILVQGLKQSAINSTLATATQLVNDRIQTAQSLGPTCSSVTGVAGVQNVTDPRGIGLRVTTTAGSCPTGTGTVSVRSTVVRLDTNATLATANTLVFVTS